MRCNICSMADLFYDTSNFLRVMAGDVSGRVYDGENPDLIDVDYTDEATAVTVHFVGFLSSQCGGFSQFLWAIGEGWEGEKRESVMEFTDRGMVVDTATGFGHAQVLTIPSNSVTSSV